ncbi:MAG: bifunctional adenosylcobinamide kinase/adenosylcobinamide-phosphate guanylyltransferase [Dehalococcoidia bacterium]
MSLVLVLGGVRSGKSRFAQELAQERGERVLFVATAAPGDQEMERRIALHQRDRSIHWRTVEALTGAGEAILREAGDAQVVIVDCLTLLLSNLWGGEEEPVEALEERALFEVEGLVRAARELSAHVIVVSNEVGLGLVPPYPVGRAYRDLLGLANQRLAQEADEVYFLMAGLPLRLKPQE